MSLPSDKVSKSAKDICKMFEAQVQLTPDAVAVSFKELQLTYRELNCRVNQLAHKLQLVGVGAEVLVGICVERSLEMIIGIFGILKAGGAYLPLDPGYPEERLAFMLADSQTPVLLTQQHLLERIPGNAKVICLDNWEIIASESDENPINMIASENLAYVIYTSGSTGKPKGVQITHRNLVHSTTARITYYSEPITSFLLLSSFAFDSSVAGIFWTLCQGGTLFLPQEGGAQEVSELIKLIFQNHVSHILTLPSVYALILEEAKPEQLGSLRTVIVAGEPCSRVLSRYHFEILPAASLFNEYGPTEGTVWSSVYNCRSEELKTQVPIGRPIPNTQIYLLNSDLQLVSPGVSGELYIGGDGLARGYLNQPQLTVQKFIHNLFSNHPEMRLYKTGDLARYLPDGNIEFIGRSDNQVKIRGYRIELEEVEAVLIQHPLVQSGVVIVQGDTSDEQRLVAYLVPKQAAPSISELRCFMKAELPEYMLPSAFILLSALPLTANGKVDRRILPLPDRASSSESAFVAYRDIVELQLTKIWEDVLGIQPVGIRDNFFDLGGHSLKALQLFSQIEKVFGKNLTLATLFQKATIEQLANVIRKEENWLPYPLLVPIQTGGDKPPLFCPHGAGGHILVYRDLARYLGPEQPVYGLQAQGLDGKKPAYAPIEERAVDYIKQIRAIQPKGPYFLAGLSSGGNIAFEMAQQLHLQGEKVALLALLDSFAPGYLQPLPTIPRLRSLLFYVTYQQIKKIYHSIGKLIRLKPEEQLIFIIEKTKAKVKIFKCNGKPKEEVTKGQQQFIQVADKTQNFPRNNNFLEQWIHTLSNFLSERTPWNNFGVKAEFWSQPKLPKALESVHEANIKAANSYVHKPYPGRVILFRAKEQPPGFYQDPKLGWGRLVLGGLDVHEIPGLHWTIVREPNVQVLAEKLKACLDKTQVAS